MKRDFIEPVIELIDLNQQEVLTISLGLSKWAGEFDLEYEDIFG